MKIKIYLIEENKKQRCKNKTIIKIVLEWISGLSKQEVQRKYVFNFS